MDALGRWLRRLPLWFSIPAGIIVGALAASLIAVAAISPSQPSGPDAGSGETSTTTPRSAPASSTTSSAAAPGQGSSSTPTSASPTTITSTDGTPSTTTSTAPTTTTTTGGAPTTTTTAASYSVRTTMSAEYGSPSDGRQKISVTVFRQSASETGGVTAVPSGTATIEQDGTTVCAVTLKADGSFNGSGSCTYSYTGSEPFTFVYSGDQYYDGFTYQYTTNTYVYD